MHLLVALGTSTIVLFISLILYLKWKLTYWQRKGLEYIEPELFFGNIREQLTEKLSFGDQFQKFYTYFKSRGLKHGGIYMFSKPVFIPIDPDLIKHIVKTDFTSFLNHGLLYVNEEVDPLTAHLFNLENEKWRNMRTRMTPAFTSGK